MYGDRKSMSTWVMISATWCITINMIMSLCLRSPWNNSSGAFFVYTFGTQKTTNPNLNMFEQEQDVPKSEARL